MEIVEHQDERLLAQCDRASQRGERQITRDGNVERECDRLSQAAGLVVRLVEREPGHLPRVDREPVSEQRGLAVAGGGHDQGERHVPRLGEAAQQPFAPQRPRAEARRTAMAQHRVGFSEENSGPVSHLTIKHPPGSGPEARERASVSHTGTHPPCPV